MNYGSMSDFEINKLIATAWLPCDYDFDEKDKAVDLVGYVTYLGGHGIPDERLEKYGEFNPCNNASDAWPIITENEIGINKLKCEPLWIADKGDRYARDKNPLRAAMIVFLMMNENK